MSPQRGTVGLVDRLELFDEALALAEGRVDAGAVAASQAVRSRVDERLARGDRIVVAAFAGGTGTGKSSLFNAVAGEAIAETGVRRPVTAEPQALVAGDMDEATPLLDWLQIRRRHLTDVNGLPEGLVLVDLPDHDSVVRDHHATSNRLVERVDLLVWVVDPLKYSRRDLHADALLPVAAHADVLLAVMNHADELSDEDRRACADDLRRLLAAEGLGEATVLVTSARTGEGVAALRARLVEEAGRRHAAVRRVEDDVRLAARRLRKAALGDDELEERKLDDGRLVDALAGAAGVDSRAGAAAGEYRSEARAASRPLLSALLAGLWELVRGLVRSARQFAPPRRGSRRAATPGGAAPSAVRHAVLELVDAIGGRLPPPARASLHAAAGVDAETLGTDVTRAVDVVTLRAPRRGWWGPTRFALSIAELAAATGFLWLALLWAVDWLRLPGLPVPTLVGEVPWPTALLAGGLLLRALGGAVRRRAVASGAARHGEEVRARLADAVRAVARERVTEPLRAEFDSLRRLVDALDRAGA